MSYTITYKENEKTSAHCGRVGTMENVSFRNCYTFLNVKMYDSTLFRVFHRHKELTCTNMTRCLSRVGKACVLRKLKGHVSFPDERRP